MTGSGGLIEHCSDMAAVADLAANQIDSQPLREQHPDAVMLGDPRRTGEPRSITMDPNHAIEQRPR